MRYVQSLPPLVEPEPESGAVRPTEHVAAAHRVMERTLLPMIYRRWTDTAAMPAIHHWTPRQRAVENERRRLCRRVNDAIILQELRSGPDRRHRNQRRDDITTAIDEKI